MMSAPVKIGANNYANSFDSLNHRVVHRSRIRGERRLKMTEGLIKDLLQFPFPPLIMKAAIYLVIVEL